MGHGEGSGQGLGEGHGEGRGEGHGEGHGEDAVEGLAAGGAAACCFLIFMWVVGLPMLLSGIAIIYVFEDGGIYTAGIVLIVISSICIVIGIVLIIVVCVVGGKNKTGPTNTSTVRTTGAVIHPPVYGAQPQGYGARPPGYTQHPAQPPPYSQGAQHNNPAYPPPGQQQQYSQPTVNPYQRAPQPATSGGTPAPPGEQEMYPPPK